MPKSNDKPKTSVKKKLKRIEKDTIIVNPSYEDIVAEELKLIERINNIIKKRKNNEL